MSITGGGGGLSLSIGELFCCACGCYSYGKKVGGKRCNCCTAITD